MSRSHSLFDHLDTLLRQLKDGNCVRIVVAKPYGPEFQALVKAQRHNETLPNKLTEMIIHQQAVRTNQYPYPFLPIPSLAPQEYSANTPSQYISTHQTNSANTPSQYTSTHQTKSANMLSQYTSTHQKSTPPTYMQETPSQMGSAQAGPSTSLTPPDPGVKIPRNRSGQRVDPRVDALAFFISAARKRKICYEHHLMGYCNWRPEPCPNTHGTETLSVHQLNALQVLARELPCHRGNACQDWACCFDHRCPFGERCNRGGNCHFLEICTLLT